MDNKQAGKIENYVINNSRLKLRFVDIENALQEYCMILNIDDPQKLTSQQYSGFCNYVGTKYFKNSGCLLCHEIVRKAMFPTSGNVLIPALIDRLLDVYVFLCQRYSKKISAYDFSLFCGIALDTLQTWTNEDEIYNSNDIQNNVIYDKDNDIYIDFGTIKHDKFLIVQKLYNHSKESYFNILSDNKNAIAQIQYGRSKGFINAMEDARNNIQVKLSLSASDLPKLTG